MIGFKIITIDLFKKDIAFFNGSSVNEINNFLKKFNYSVDEKEFQRICGKFIMFENTASLVWVRDKTKNINPVLSHEIFHCAVAILNSIGVSFSDSSEEVYAYLIEEITRKILKVL